MKTPYLETERLNENVMIKLGFNYVKDIPYECNDDSVALEGKMYNLIL